MDDRMLSNHEAHGPIVSLVVPVHSKTSGDVLLKVKFRDPSPGVLLANHSAVEAHNRSRC